MSTQQMPFADLEQVYDRLARAIDNAGTENESLMLTKLCLILAHRLGDLDSVENAIETAFKESSG